VLLCQAFGQKLREFRRESGAGDNGIDACFVSLAFEFSLDVGEVTDGTNSGGFDGRDQLQGFGEIEIQIEDDERGFLFDFFQSAEVAGDESDLSAGTLGGVLDFDREHEVANDGEDPGHRLHSIVCNK
jgi:hypothetical protein